MFSATKVAIHGEIWAKPARTTQAARILDKAKPDMPTMISGLRPCLSDNRAHIGAQNAQNSAESAKIATAASSGMPVLRLMAGSTVTRPILPAAVSSETANRI